MTLARDGAREMAIMAIVCGVLATALAWWWPLAALLPALLLVGGLAFFRVPRRSIPDGPNLLVSPADGKVTEITQLEHDPRIGGPATRIGIFLSVFDVHVNRAPCEARVIHTEYKPGEFLDARHAECGARNEATTITFDPAAPYPGPIVVRQIAGLIARRIVCRLTSGQVVRRGELFGLIKFGSRTELIVPAGRGYEPAVQIGQHVAGGSTILMRWQGPADSIEAKHGSDRQDRSRRATAPSA